MHVYTSGHAHSLTVASAFASGSGLPLVGVDNGLQPGGVFTYGNLRGLKPILDRAIAEGRDWYYADRGYFLATAGNDYSGYFRVTRNAYQHDGRGDATPKRWEQLGKLLLPWKRDGDHVLVCPPSSGLASLRGFDADAWLQGVLAVLAGSTDREVRVRAKPGKTPPEPLSQALAGAHAVVTHSSNAAVDAVVAGVPVFCTAPCAAHVMGSPDLRRIDTPSYPDREPWAWNLAAAQWTLAEMRDGTCWRELNGG